jgi:hypothetical protein
VSFGQHIIETIIRGKLFRMECSQGCDHGILCVWSAAAAEQLDALIADLKVPPTGPVLVIDRVTTGNFNEHSASLVVAVDGREQLLAMTPAAMEDLAVLVDRWREGAKR